VELSPAVATLTPGATQQFSATVQNATEGAVRWSVEEATGGTVSDTGLYQAPSAEGTYHVRATSVAHPDASALATVTVLPRGSAPAFFAPAQPMGQVAVRLYPTESVTAGTSVLVTFGFPFPRGSLTREQLRTVRVLSGGNEIPAFVEEHTPWRHLRDSARDGSSVRVARVQLRHTFTTLYPGYETVTVSWGGPARTQSRPAFEDPRGGWHLVTSGTYVAADGVQEPDVYAVLPASWMTQGLFKPMRMDAFDASVTEARSDPAVTDATENYPGYVEEQHAAKNFFYSVINQDDARVTVANQCPYKTDSEPWLYDRAATMHQLYFRSGFFRALREAVRASEFYRRNLYAPGTQPPEAVGMFKLKNPDPAGYIGGNGAMYSYAENLAYAAWVTGDDQMREAIRWVAQGHLAQEDGEPMRWSSTASGWTERHTAFRLLAHVVAYEVFGDAAYANNVRTWTGDFIWHQDGAGGQLPASRIDGALWHRLAQHEGVDGPLMASPWMSALTVDAMVRAYASSEDEGIANFIRRMGTFFKAATKRVEPTLYDYTGQLREVDYITQIDGATYASDGTTPEHSLELAASVAWAHYFARLTGRPDPALKTTADELYLTFDVGVNYWTRPAAPSSGLTAYRVAPCRKWGWAHRPSGSLSWALRE
jgi:hypothetical protein